MRKLSSDIYTSLHWFKTSSVSEYIKCKEKNVASKMAWIVLLFLKTKRVINEQVMQQRGKRAPVPPYLRYLTFFC